MNTFKKKLYNICRNYLKRYFTGNLGKVIEEEDRLVCYVKKRKCKKDKYSYTIPCFGITEQNQKLAKKFKLNKPICYIIDGIKIEKKRVYIFGYNDCEIIVKNCKFNWGANISVSGKCTLESTFIREFHLLSIMANEMIVKNMNLNHEMKLAGSSLKIKIGANRKLSLFDSNIGERFDTVKVDVISSNELNMTNSKIIGNEIKIKSPTIEVDEISSFIALKNVNIEIDDFKKLNIDSPSTIFNGKDISEYGKILKLKKYDNPLKNKRLEFLEVLKKIRNDCNEINAEMAKKYKDSLNNQSVSRVLKK